MSREGRAQPVQPFATHGFVGNTPANGVLPGRIVVCENDDRRRRTPPPQPVVISGAYASVTAPVIFPPEPLVLDRADQRGRYRPPDAISISAALASVAPPATPVPPGPYVVPVDERRRFLAQLPPAVLRGYDDADPPLPTVVEPDDRRRRRPTPDPLTFSGALATFFGPFVGPPPPIFVMQPVDTRRYRAPDAVWIASTIGATIPFIVAPPVTVLGGTDWAAEIATF